MSTQSLVNQLLPRTAALDHATPFLVWLATMLMIPGVLSIVDQRIHLETGRRLLKPPAVLDHATHLIQNSTTRVKMVHRDFQFEEEPKSRCFSTPLDLELMNRKDLMLLVTIRHRRTALVVVINTKLQITLQVRFSVRTRLKHALNTLQLQLLLLIIYRAVY